MLFLAGAFAAAAVPQTHEGDIRLTAVYIPTNHVSVSCCGEGTHHGLVNFKVLDFFLPLSLPSGFSHGSLRRHE
jgi:D-tyrosyl-tRNA(Tyr) deacylase